jgi:UDP-N-acetylmuramoyl-L-alanyl-D-glutamate--2,6-diaminopimelate ligase
MLLSKLLELSGISSISSGGEGNPEIKDICYDSRSVVPGALYVAIPGTKVHGDNFIIDALAKGASAVLTENPQPALKAPWVMINNTRAALGRLGSALWNVNIKKLYLAAITGTNGKTTTAHLYKKLLEQRFSLQKVWMFGTINYQLGSEVKPSDHTTPEALEVLRLAGTSSYHPEAIVMEVSSHSLALDRIGGLSYDLAVWTNLTQDHLDFHKNMENYYNAKKRLFCEYLKKGGNAVVNCDDLWGRKLIRELSDVRVISYGRSEDACVKIVDWKCDWDGCSIKVEYDGSLFEFRSSLRGYFNVYNMTALVAGGFAAGFTKKEIENAFSSVITVPGRMDRVEIDSPFAVIVDYAHTPDALENILETARPLTSGKLICVFGCGGDRDRTKRPIMGKIVAKKSDEAIVTSDNPRSEQPMAIIDEILNGIPLDFPHRVLTDRREAIRIALMSAKAGDCVVIAGKGHEDYQEIRGVKHHFDDREVVRELYAQMKEENK